MLFTLNIRNLWKMAGLTRGIKDIKKPFFPSILESSSGYSSSNLPGKTSPSVSAVSSILSILASELRYQLSNLLKDLLLEAFTTTYLNSNSESYSEAVQVKLPTTSEFKAALSESSSVEVSPLPDTNVRSEYNPLHLCLYYLYCSVFFFLISFAYSGLYLASGLRYLTPIPKIYQSTMSSNPPPSSSNSEQEASTPMSSIGGPRLVIPMPYPSSPEAPYFDGANVTDFVEKFDELCSDRGLTDLDKCKRVVKYCDPETRGFIESLPEYIDKTWKPLMRVLIKEYGNQDESQLRMTRPYLEAYVRKSRTSPDDIITYCRSFACTSSKLLKENKLDIYTQFQNFLMGLPTEYRKAAIKSDVDIDNITTDTFDTVKKSVQKMATFNKKLQEMTDISNLSKIQELVDRSSEKKSAFTKALADPRPSTAVVIPVANTKHAPATYADHMNKRMDEMTKQLETLTLSLSTRPSGYTPNGGRYQNDRPPPENCSYCGAHGHYLKRECGVFNDDLHSGRIHMNEGKIALGPLRRDSIPIPMRRGFTQRQCVEQAEKLSYASTKPESNVSTVRVDSFVDDVSGLSTDEEEDLPSGFVLSSDTRRVEAARTEKPKETVNGSEAWRSNQKIILKRRMQDENKMAKPKTTRYGSWKPSEEQVIKEELTENPRPIQETPASIITPKIELPKDNHNYRSYVEEESDEDVSMTEAPDKAKSVKFTKPVVSPTKTDTTPKALTAKPTRPLDSYKDLYSDPMMTDKVLKTEVPMPLAWILNHWPEVMKTLSNRPLKISTPDAKGEARVRSIDHGQFPITPTNDHYVISTPRAPVRFNTEARYEALLDTGAEINVMTKEVAMRENLPIRANPLLKMVSHTGHRRDFIGVCEDVLVNIGGMKTRVPIFIVDGADHQLVLGQPFFIKSRCRFVYKEDGMYAEVLSKDGSAKYSFKATDVGDRRNKRESDVFPYIYEPENTEPIYYSHDSLN